MGNTSPLRHAMLENEDEKVKEILDEAGDGAPDLINEDYTSDCLCSRSRNVQTPLHTAIARDKVAIVAIFVKYGADVNSTGYMGQTGLHVAAKRNNVQLCRLAMDNGADITIEDHDGRYAIHHAAMSSVGRNFENIDALKYILEEIGNPEDINIADVDGRTPLHLAARYGHHEAVRYLVEKGSDINAKSSHGKTPEDEAAIYAGTMSERQDSVKYLQKIKSQNNTSERKKLETQNEICQEVEPQIDNGS